MLGLNKLASLRLFQSLYRQGLSYPLQPQSRDYNLKNSTLLYKILRVSSKTIIFPHSTALMSNFGSKPNINKVKYDFFIENTKFHDRFLPYYKNNMRVVGSPGLDEIRNKVLNDLSDHILIITRNCDKNFFGFDYDSSFIVLDEILSWAKKNNIKTHIKHHPRDTRVNDWRKVTARYANSIEIFENLSDNKNKYKYCFCFYTSAFIPIIARNILAIDISPYKKTYFKNLPYHKWENEPRHEFSELELLPIIKFSQFLKLNKKELNKLRNLQLASLDKVFPNNSINSINKILEA